MNNKKISSLEFICMMLYPIISLYITFSSYFTNCFNIIIGYILGIIVLFIFMKIFNYREKENIIDKNKYLFGNLIGNIINLFISILFFLIGVYILKYLTEFSISMIIQNTSYIVFMVLLGLIIVYQVTKGINNISRVLFLLSISFIVISIISYLGIMPNIKINNLMGIINNNSLIYLSMIDIISINLLLIIEKDKIIMKKGFSKKVFFFYTFLFIIIFLDNFSMIGSLGNKLVNYYKYPLYMVLTNVSFFKFINRVEFLYYIRLFLSCYGFLSLIIYHITCLFPRIKKSIISIITIILMILLSNIRINYFISYIGILLLFIYLIIFIKIKTRYY